GPVRGEAQGLAAGPGRPNLEALLLQHQGEEVTEVLVVIHVQDGGWSIRHVGDPPRSASHQDRWARDDSGPVPGTPSAPYSRGAPRMQQHSRWLDGSMDRRFPSISRGRALSGKRGRPEKKKKRQKAT